MDKDKFVVAAVATIWGIFVRSVACASPYENLLADSKKHYYIRNNYLIFDRIDIRDRETNHSIKKEYSFFGKSIPIEFLKDSILTNKKF